ncbi:MAG: hypothetical protein PVJ08_07145 [Dehalococcoidia bacterium]|jgi:hypothetical protein
MSTPQDEAIAIFKTVLDNFFKDDVNIKNVLRLCFHACQLLGWKEQQDWFNFQLHGYPEGIEIPAYRKIVGHTKWVPTGGFRTVIDSVIDDEDRTKEEPSEKVSLEVVAGIDWIVSAAQHGYHDPTGKKSKRYISFRHKNIEIEEIRQYDGSSFQAIIQNIEDSLFQFSSDSYSILCYGDSLQDVWLWYRNEVDKHLIEIGFGGHLDAVRSGLNSNNSQEWRQAMWSCRDILHDLADYLWKDTRETYDPLPGKDGKLKVTKNHYINRLSAYLHYKGTKGKTGIYIHAEMERIYHSIDTLNDLDSKAHSEITITDVRTAAMGTYFILGELIIRTDMQPVIHY